MIAAAKAAHTLRTTSSKFRGIGRSKGKGNDDDVIINMKDIKRDIQDKIQHIHDEDDSPEAMAKLGIDTILGYKATLINDHTVDLTGSVSGSDAPTTTTVRATMGMIIATGASPMEPTTTDDDDDNKNAIIEGLSTVPFLTYEQIFDLEEIPKRLTVIGGGPIGCELAQAFGRLGSIVTQVSESYVCFVCSSGFFITCKSSNTLFCLQAVG